MNKLRKFLVIGVMAITSVMTMGSFSPVASASASAGDLIKMSGLSSVYYLGSDGKRYVFPNTATYMSWYSDFSGVVTIPATELQSYPLGGNITMRPGTKLVKITTDPSVYAVTPNGVLAKIGSEAQASALYGTNWNKNVVDVPDAFFTNYTIGTPLTDGQIPAGSLVKNAGATAVYYYDGTNYRSVASEAAMNANRFSMANILTISNTIIATGAAITGAESALVTTSQSGATGVISVVTGSGLMVSLNSATPASTTIISGTGSASGQSIAPLTSFNLTAANDGAITLKSLRLQRIGVSSDNTLANVYLYNGTTKLTDAGNFSNGYVTFSNNIGIVTIPAGQTVTLTVRADVAGSATGNIGVAIASASDVVSTGATVSGSFPLNGNLMSVTSVTDLATVTAGTISPTGANNTVNAGTLTQTLWSSQLSVGQKAVKLSYVAFRQIGSISADAIQNLGLYVNGSQVGANTSIGSDGYVRFDLTNSPVTLSTGASTVELRGDIVKGSNSNYTFSVQTAADMVLTDTNYGVNVSVAAQGSATLPLTAGSTKISSGTVSAQKDPSFTSTQFVANQAQTVLGQWTMKAYGEDIKVQQLQANITVSDVVATSTIAQGFNNVTLYVNGGSVGSSMNAVKVINSTSTAFALPVVTFGSTNLFTIPAGTTVTVTLKGDSTLDPHTTVTSATANLVAPINAFMGITSFTYTPTPSAQTIPGTALSIGTGNATVAKNGGYTDQSLAGNTIAQKIGSFTIQANSADGVKVTSLSVDLTSDGTHNVDLTKMANLYIVTPDMTNGSNKVNPSTTNNFTTNFTIPANGTANVDVYADLTDITGNFMTKLSGNGLGVTSNQSVSLVSASGQVITVGTGSLNSFALSNSSPVSQIVVGGTNNQAIATYNFVASTTGGVNITELGFTVASSTSQATAVSSVTIGGSTAVVVNGIALVTGLNLNVPASYGGLDVPVTVNFAPVGLNGVPDQLVTLSLAHVKYLAGGATNTADASISSPFASNAFGGKLNTAFYNSVTNGTPANPMQVAGVAPIVSLVAAGGNLTTGIVKIGSVNIVAPTGNMILTNLPITISASGATTTLASTSPANILVKDSSTGQTITTTYTDGSAGTSTITFANNYTIAAGQTGKTFDIYANVSSIAGQSGTGRVNLGLGSSSLFSWKDVNGNTVLDGSKILNYPNTTVSLVN